MVPGRGGEILSPPAVRFLEIAGGPHRVDQIVDRVDALEGRLERGRVENVGADRFGLGAEAAGERLRPPGQAPHAAATRLQQRQEPPADVSGGAGQGDQRAVRHSDDLRHESASSTCLLAESCELNTCRTIPCLSMT